MGQRAVLSIIHFASTVSVAGFQLSHTMVAGVTPPDTGYGGGFGSLVPDQLNGELVTQFKHNTTIGGLIIIINQSGGVGTILQDFWTRILFQSDDPNWDGVIALSADAGSFDNTLSAANWQFPGGIFDNIFINAETYLLDWRV